MWAMRATREAGGGAAGDAGSGIVLTLCDRSANTVAHALVRAVSAPVPTPLRVCIGRIGEFRRVSFGYISAQCRGYSRNAQRKVLTGQKNPTYYRFKGLIVLETEM